MVRKLVAYPIALVKIYSHKESIVALKQIIVSASSNMGSELSSEGGMLRAYKHSTA